MNTQYWINKGGKQSGPHSIEELQQMILDKNTYVWYSGMDDWKKIVNMPELAHLVAAEETPAEEEKAVEYVPIEENPIDDAAAEESPAEEVAHEDSLQPAATPPAYTAPEPPTYTAPAYQQPAMSEPCPPTNLAASIILTLLCCMPFGVAGIVFAVQVKKYYNMGDMAKAKKYSEWGAWCCILSMVFSIFSMPLQFFLI